MVTIKSLMLLFLQIKATIKPVALFSCHGRESTHIRPFTEHNKHVRFDFPINLFISENYLFSLEEQRLLPVLCCVK